MLGLAVLSLSLIACGGDDDDPEPEETTTTTEEPEDTEPDDAEEDESEDESDDDEGDDAAPAASAEVTAPGTELAVGDTAVLPYDDSEAGLAEITVTEIVPGDKEAFDAAFGEDAATIDPFYIRYTVTIVSIDPEDPPGSAPRLSGVNADGRSTGTIISGSLDDCEPDNFGSDAAVGDTIETCRIQGATNGETIAGARYNEGIYFDEGPVLWMS